MNELRNELGLLPSAGWAEVQRSFRRRVFELHPDRSGGVAGAGLAELTRLFNLAKDEQPEVRSRPGLTPHSAGCPWAPQKLRERFESANTVAQRKKARVFFARAFVKKAAASTCTCGYFDS
ncbi:unnamed protein product [Bursaphelenchus okinawaensis]|uniref:J domain-containing protein n=1 Tax=Bursaphelenchus okinawaensis TaxID=465554 RepID=A0A811KBN3_9BILA|nr:unnamed protein product [Bursaphelenchus okinawaensis]CAG9097554.1 unnamed protein product [Bursaphelenchus okinawaensis]